MSPPRDADERSLDPDAHREFLERALAEDRAADDVTTAALVDPARRAAADLVAKVPGVVCGLPLVGAVFRLLEEDAQTETFVRDGDVVEPGARVATVRASAQTILRGERTALNVVQRLSGVATRTAAFASKAGPAGVAIFDTRKTTPGWRVLEKYAVRCGGGRNHRMDLADAAMIKENHLVAAHGRTGADVLAQAVRACRERLPAGIPLYVEVESQAELEAALEAAGERRGEVVFMLDDFDLDAIRAAVAFVAGTHEPRPQLEATGGVTLERVEALAATGVERLSAGSLTHSAPALDLSLKIRREG
jgi:nicotinate-nucleotide pyrophosphorylase (carboxylating)